MTTTFIATSTKKPSRRKFAAMKREIRAIDPSMTLCEIDQPGNSIRVYIERPNDGTNQNIDQRELNRRAAAVIA